MAILTSSPLHHHRMFASNPRGLTCTIYPAMIRPTPGCPLSSNIHPPNIHWPGLLLPVYCALLHTLPGPCRDQPPSSHRVRDSDSYPSTSQETDSSAQPAILGIVASAADRSRFGKGWARPLSEMRACGGSGRRCTAVSAASTTTEPALACFGPHYCTFDGGDLSSTTFAR